MKGSEKQIKWAMDIKESAIMAMECIVRNAENGCYDYRLRPISVDVAKDLQQMIKTGFESMDDAAHIINIRHRFTQWALEKMAADETHRRNQQ